MKFPLHTLLFRFKGFDLQFFDRYFYLNDPKPGSILKFNARFVSEKSIVASIVCEAFAKSGGKGRLSVLRVKMRNIAKACHSEGGNALAALFCDKSCNGRGKCAGGMPKDHWRSVHKMGEQNAFKPEVAE